MTMRLSSLSFLILVQSCASLLLLESLLPKNISFKNPTSFFGILSGDKSKQGSGRGNKVLEKELLKAIQDGGNRLANSDRISQLIESLESSPSIQKPAIAPEIYGRWKLLYTTNADTSSPIQRKAVDSQIFPIYQDIEFNDRKQLIVGQIVKFSDQAELRVDALASTSAYPLAELTERKSPSTLGFTFLGTSLVGESAQPDPTRPDSRIDFVFDEGNFDFGNFRIPYPVPFRLPLLRDVVKGWIDITYLSDTLRVSRGNKGTTFVLQREASDENE